MLRFRVATGSGGSASTSAMVKNLCYKAETSTESWTWSTKIMMTTLNLDSYVTRSSSELVSKPMTNRYYCSYPPSMPSTYNKSQYQDVLFTCWIDCALHFRGSISLGFVCGGQLSTLAGREIQKRAPRDDFKLKRQKRPGEEYR